MKRTYTRWSLVGLVATVLVVAAVSAVMSTGAGAATTTPVVHSTRAVDYSWMRSDGNSEVRYPGNQLVSRPAPAADVQAYGGTRDAAIALASGWGARTATARTPEVDLRLVTTNWPAAAVGTQHALDLKDTVMWVIIYRGADLDLYGPAKLDPSLAADLIRRSECAYVSLVDPVKMELVTTVQFCR
jgi:hypothetical protein